MKETPVNARVPEVADGWHGLCQGRLVIEAGEMRSLESMKKHLFIVDDDSAVRSALKQVLEGIGYHVVVAADGVEAQTKLEDPNADLTLDLLIVDLNMPNRDGWDVLEDANRHHPFLPVIIITGLSAQLETHRIPGVAALMKKPLDVPMLLGKIEELLAESPEKRLQRVSGYFAIESVWPKGTSDRLKSAVQVTGGALPPGFPKTSR